ncbi:acyclic terpene utilization AtuA family protein [Natronosalvus rutilus]|uniref:DUF1446 domain-containing protein n=1 Tax=Natronosalvus rutilus TaxID=2953753 RepID=A0A9E7NDB0_9EURY|nr:acyclic terpene utilization AtuA family protein [Natronosalvus rutilus]UTF54783.1 DUF1446 domain-containing protein [Natronosalvus rutilus]
MEEVDILCPTGHLATVPFEEESFWRGVEKEPDFICADSGSNDIGPQPFGSDTPVCEEKWQQHDLELMLRGSRQLDVPMIIGSASDTGSNRGVDQFVRLINETADEYDLDEFTLATIYSDVDRESLIQRIDGGEVVEGLHDRAPLDTETIAETDPIVAAMGVEPIIEALDGGADVIICGRAVDPAIFAAPAIWSGMPKDIAYFSGKVMECASFLAKPFAGKESIMGTIREEEVVLEALSEYQHTTPESVAGHAMYERADPNVEHVPGGYVDMENCVYESVDGERTRVSGPVFHDSDSYKVKLEGASAVGERRIKVVGLRDPKVIEQIDEAIAYSREKVAEQFEDDEYEVHYHVYGKNGVMGELEPTVETASHELAVVVEGIAPTEQVAKEVTSLAGSSFFYVRLPGIKGTAGTAAFMSDEVFKANRAYEWSVNHLLELDHPRALHEVEYTTVGGEADA